VNPDCTGSMTRNVSSGVTARDDLMIDDDGVEIRALSSDPGEIDTYVSPEAVPRRSLGILEDLTDVAKLGASRACSRNPERFVSTIGKSPMQALTNPNRKTPTVRVPGG
jgi:hypothetical protein